MESREAFDLDVNHYLSALKRSWIPAASIFLATVLLAALYAARLKPTYEADTKLLFRIDNSSALTGLDDSDSSQTNSLRSLLIDQSPLNSEVEVITSRPLLQKAIDQLSLQDQAGQPLTIKELKERLDVKLVGATDVVQITYTGDDPQQAANIVNTIAELYIAQTKLNERSDTTTVREFINQQLPQTEANVRRAEAELRSFRERNRVVALTNETESAVDVIENLDNQMMNTQSQLGEITARAESIRNQIGLGSQAAIEVSALSQSPAIQGVLTELQDVQRQIAAENPRFTGNSPVVIRLHEREASLRQLLEQEVKTVLGSSAQVPPGLLQIGELKQDLIGSYLAAETERRSLAERLASLQNSKLGYQTRVNVLPRLEEEQRQLERKLDAAQETYETLLTQSQELQVKERQSTNAVRVIEPAIAPDEPQGGDKLKVLAIGLIGGALLGMTVILIQGLKDGATNQLPRDGYNGGRSRQEEERELPRV